jgi:calcineurin-like phosphoesterase family protein
VHYDIIGDIHGHALTLEALLEQLGYNLNDGIYQHPDRQVIFLGDFIDTGPYQRRTLEIVHPMVESGHALAVLGNHEFNAIAYATPRDETDHLRPRNEKNAHQHAAFLAEYPVDSQDYCEVIDWFRTLPLWLNLGPLRVIHACWDRQLIQKISQYYDGARMTDALLHQASTRGRWEYEAVETLLKGKEIPLPDGHRFLDRYGNQRHHIRIRWWDRNETTYRGKFLGAQEWETHVPDDPIEGDHGIEYGLMEPPVFLGHYWLAGAPKPLESNVACLDYSVAKPGGKLVAYRWNGESKLHANAFVSVERLEP